MDTQHQNSTFTCRKVIGKGSYGVVSLGIRDSDGQVFAVKSADKDSLPSVQALENEIRILRSLSSSSSPFIVEYYGDDETSAHRNLFMEYVSGGDVASSGGIADVELIRSYTWCLLTALKTVHSHGIVHCDIKGSNVLIDSNAGVAKLADFGSAKMKMIDDVDQKSKVVPRGSPLWMAPEVVRGESQGFESDIWSLGCTVLEMFTGLPAWQDCGAHTLFKIGYSNELPEYPAGLPESARDFLSMCLNRDPAQRWSCDQLLQHPFLLPTPATKITESSPRSVLANWHALDFSDDDDDDDLDESDGGDSDLARERIGKLATSSAVNWESDGWVEVRSLDKEENDEFETESNSEYSDFEAGMEVITLQEHDCEHTTWISPLYDDLVERESGGGHDGDRYGDHSGTEWANYNSETRTEENETAVQIDSYFLICLLYSPTIMGINYDNNKNTPLLDNMLIFQFVPFNFYITSLLNYSQIITCFN